MPKEFRVRSFAHEGGPKRRSPGKRPRVKLVTIVSEKRRGGARGKKFAKLTAIAKGMGSVLDIFEPEIGRELASPRRHSSIQTVGREVTRMMSGVVGTVTREGKESTKARKAKQREKRFRLASKSGVVAVRTIGGERLEGRIRTVHLAEKTR